MTSDAQGQSYDVVVIGASQTGLAWATTLPRRA